ncbi:hypothetical protein CcCBS67573_g06770 [Chytriomyces confervae]|uniref:Uncharacterized protein n=1 Tax=Chytriomyces confervae TaxID=246404 RepID=A0A507F0W5_9FUNG|nr:hypothetical protein CcCBS67573_g06770 [Chytriomyces confervae]
MSSTITSQNAFAALLSPRPTTSLTASTTAVKLNDISKTLTTIPASASPPLIPTSFENSNQSAPSRSINYASAAQWDSPEIAYLFLALTVIASACIFRNLIFKAKTRQTKAIYIYLSIWCIARVACFAMRGYILTGDNGENYSFYQWTSIVSSLGFMPLSEAMAVITVEGCALVFGFSKKLASRLDLTVKLLFITFGCCVAGSVMDFTLNRPLGSNMKDYTTDLVLREVGFNGLILLTLFAAVGCTVNMMYAVVTWRISTKLVLRFNLMMCVTAFQAILILIKLVYISYRNWNPLELRSEAAWYAFSIMPEYIVVLFYVSHFFASVFDKAHCDDGKEADAIRELEAGTPDLRADYCATPETKDKPLPATPHVLVGKTVRFSANLRECGSVQQDWAELRWFPRELKCKLRKSFNVWMVSPQMQL